MIGMWCLLERSDETVDLPEAMPPVRPTTGGERVVPGQLGL